jgi:hypothetical protein
MPSSPSKSGFDNHLTASLLKALWDPFPIKAGGVVYASLGPLELWVRRVGDDWYIAHRRPESEVRACAPKALQPTRTLDELPWSRWVSSRPAGRIRLVPALPDRAVVVRPKFPLKVPSGESVLFYVNVPLWVRVAVGDEFEQSLSEVPSIVLSNTWFGELTGGELCYALKTKALRDLEEVSNRPYTATCPVTVENSAPTDLDFQRICLRVEHLHVYRGARRLWTNQVEVFFKGEDFTSQVNVLKYAPTLEATSERLCAARQPVERSLLAKSFSFLRALTSF